MAESGDLLWLCLVVLLVAALGAKLKSTFRPRRPRRPSASLLDVAQHLVAAPVSAELEELPLDSFAFTAALQYAKLSLKLTYDLCGERSEDVVRAVHSVLHGHDTLLAVPTGTGKSTAFQILPFVRCATLPINREATSSTGVVLCCTSVVLVIVPLTAIADQQCAALTAAGVSNIFALPSTPPALLREIAAGSFSHVFVSPETIMGSDLQRKIWLPLLRDLGSRLCAIVLDEAHLQTLWGKDFRTTYGHLGDLRCHTHAGSVTAHDSNDDGVHVPGTLRAVEDP